MLLDVTSRSKQTKMKVRTERQELILTWSDPKFSTAKTEFANHQAA